MAGMDEHERELFDRAYDVSQPFNADELMDGFTMEEREVRADPRAVEAVQSGLRLLGCTHAVSCLSVEECRERQSREP
jgi:hypothetical protein